MTLTKTWKTAKDDKMYKALLKLGYKPYPFYKRVLPSSFPIRMVKIAAPASSTTFKTAKSSKAAEHLQKKGYKFHPGLPMPKFLSRMITKYPAQMIKPGTNPPGVKLRIEVWGPEGEFEELGPLEYTLPQYNQVRDLYKDMSAKGMISKYNFHTTPAWVSENPPNRVGLCKDNSGKISVLYKNAGHYYRLNPMRVYGHVDVGEKVVDIEAPSREGTLLQLFNDGNALVRWDGSQVPTKVPTSEIIGANPGAV